GGDHQRRDGVPHVGALFGGRGQSPWSTASVSREAPKRTGSEAGSPVSSSAAATAALASLSSRSRALRAIATTFAGSAISDERSWSATSSESGGIGKRSSSSTWLWPALWQRTSACGALPWSSPRVTPE